jgi:hypothetical protein
MHPPCKVVLAAAVEGVAESGSLAVTEATLGQAGTQPEIGAGLIPVETEWETIPEI